MLDIVYHTGPPPYLRNIQLHSYHGFFGEQLFGADYVSSRSEPSPLPTHYPPTSLNPHQPSEHALQRRIEFPYLRPRCSCFTDYGRVTGFSVWESINEFTSEDFREVLYAILGLQYEVKVLLGFWLSIST